MSIYLIPALLSLLFKLYVLTTVFRGGKVSIVFLSLIVIFALHNAVELTGYILLFNNSNVDLLFRPYYVITIYLIMYILLHGLTIADLSHKYITITLVCISTAFSGLILFTDSIIAGSYSIGYSMAAIEGEYYRVLAIYSLASLVCTLAVLVYGKRLSSTELNSTRCTYSLYALTPILLAFIITIICKLVEIEFNAAAILPIATTLFLLIVLKSETQHQLSDVRRFIPLSIEKQTTNNFMAVLNYYIEHQNEDDVFKTVQFNVEREIIYYSLKKCDYNVSKTTQMMGLKNRSTLYSMMNRLDIDIKGMKKDAAI